MLLVGFEWIVPLNSLVGQTMLLPRQAITERYGIYPAFSAFVAYRRIVFRLPGVLVLPTSSLIVSTTPAYRNNILLGVWPRFTRLFPV
jgi:hypothetical protein